MNMNFSRYIGRLVSIVCVFGDSKKPIYYKGVIVDYDDTGKTLTIKDKFSKTVFLDATAINQVVLEDE